MLVTIQFTLGILSWSQLIAQAVKDTRDKHQRANFATYIYTTTIHHIDMANARFPQLIEQLEANIFKALDDRVLCLTLTTPRRFMPLWASGRAKRTWHRKRSVLFTELTFDIGRPQLLRNGKFYPWTSDAYRNGWVLACLGVVGYYEMSHLSDLGLPISAAQLSISLITAGILTTNGAFFNRFDRRDLMH